MLKINANIKTQTPQYKITPQRLILFCGKKNTDTFESKKRYVFDDLNKLIEVEELDPRKYVDRYRYSTSEENLCKKDYDFTLKNKDLTLDSDRNLFKGIKDREYDIGKLMQIATNNSLRQKGNAYVYAEKLPKMFDGLNKEDIANKVTEELMKGKDEDFKICGRKFNISLYSTGGYVGRVYLIKDENGNTAAIKEYKRQHGYQNNGYTEIALSRQMTRDGVIDIPEFYMAQAADYKLGKDGKVYKMPQWLMTQAIEETTPKRFGFRGWKDWLNKNALEHCDNLMHRNEKGNYLVDLGGICSRGVYFNGEELLDADRSYKALNACFKNGMNVDEVLELYKEYFKE